MALTLDQLTFAYITLRDDISKEVKAFEEVIAPKKKLLEDLNNVLLGKLNTLKVDSVASEFGTVYKTTKKSASIVDGEVFWKFVVDNQAWDLIDKRANAPAVEGFVSQFKTLPPGVNFNQVDVVGVRRKSGK